MTLSEQIRQAREQKNLSQETLAEYLGVSRQAVSKWENGTSMPQGANRDALAQILELDFDPPQGEAPAKRSPAAWPGWAVSAVLLGAVIFLLINRGQDASDTSADQNGAEASGGAHSFTAAPGSSDEEPPAAQSPASPSIISIDFYGSDLSPVGETASWYNSAEIDIILIQWEGGTPDSIKMFYTPAGSDTLQQMELLMTKPVINGSSAVLLSADPLADKGEGHVSFELDFRESILSSETYNMFFESETDPEGFPAGETPGTPDLLAYVSEFDGIFLHFDAVEWVNVPSQRAAELEIEENDAGFYVYNEAFQMETLTLSQNCTCTLLDWESSFAPVDATLDQLTAILRERNQGHLLIPYHLTVENGEITGIREQYLP